MVICGEGFLLGQTILCSWWITSWISLVATNDACSILPIESIPSRSNAMPPEFFHESSETPLPCFKAHVAKYILYIKPPPFFHSIDYHALSHHCIFHGLSPSPFPHGLFLFIPQPPSPKERNLVLDGVDDVADDCEEDEEDDDDDCDDDVCHHHLGGRDGSFSAAYRFDCLRPWMCENLLT